MSEAVIRRIRGCVCEIVLERERERETVRVCVFPSILYLESECV